MYPEGETHFDAKQKVWSGNSKKTTFDPKVTFGEAVLLLLGINPEKVIQICDSTGDRLTCSELISLGKQVSLSLQRRGLKIGDVVGIVANNSTHLTPVMFGAILSGNPVNALFPEFHKEDVISIFSNTRPKIVFCEGQNYITVRDALSELRLDSPIYTLKDHIDGVSKVDELYGQDPKELDNYIPPSTYLSGEDTIAIVCTSGTTGTPKGVCVSHQAALNLRVFVGIRSDDILFTFSTMYWISGIWTLFASLLHGATRIITDKRFTPKYFFQLIEKYRITYNISSPSAIAQLVQSPDLGQYDLSSLRKVLCGGSAIPSIVATKISQYLPNDSLTIAYGMTELGGICSLNEGGKREKSAGKILPNIEVQVVDHQHGTPLGISETGEFRVRSLYKWNGYYNNPGETAKIYHPEHRWISTGDIGYFDSDGYMFIIDRQKDIFKCNGHQIYPVRLEDVIMRVPGVQEVCVFGIPDLVCGKKTAAAIVRSTETENKSLTEQQVHAYVAASLAPIYHILGGVFFLSEIPKTSSGKVRRNNVAKIAAEILLQQSK